MIIADVYKHFGIPPNLQLHLLKVAAVGNVITEKWKGPEINKTLILQACLLHDLANIVKFDLDRNPEYLGSEVDRLDYWREEQKRVIAKYGDNDHIATEKMLTELNMPEKLIDIVQEKSFGNFINISQSNNWELKILAYSDMRVAPMGIVPLRERLDELTKRLEKYRNHPDRANLIESAHEVEKQLQANTDTNLPGIREDNSKNVERFLQIEV